MRKYNSHRRDEGQKKSDPWTSNSDLFMAMAVIFLIMFVFAILQSGASQLAVQQEKAEAQDFLLGKLSSKNKTKNKENLEKAKKNLQQIAEKKQLLSMTLKQIGEISQAMEAREGAIEELYKQQNQNEASLSRAQEIINEQKKNLEEKETLSHQKSREIEDLKRSFASQVEQSEKQKIQKVNLAILLEEKRQEKKILEQKVSRNQERIAAASAALGKERQELIETQKKVEEIRKKSKNNEIRLENKISQVVEEKSGLESQLQLAKKNIENREESIELQSENVRRSKSEIQQLQKEMAESKRQYSRKIELEKNSYESKIETEKQKQKSLSKEIVQQNQKIRSLSHSLEEEKNSTKRLQKDFKEESRKRSSESHMVTRLNGKIERLQASLELNSKSLNKAIEMNKSLQGQIEEKKESLSKISEQLKTAGDENSRHQKQSKILASKLQQTLKDLAESKELVKKQKGTISQGQKRQVLLTENNDNLKKRIKLGHEEQSRLQAALADQVAQNGAASRKIAEYRRIEASLNQKIRAGQGQIESDQLAKSQLKSKLAASLAKVSDLQRRSRLKSEELAQLKGMQKNLEGKLANAKGKMTEARAKNGHLKSEIAGANQKQDSLIKNLQAYKSKAMAQGEQLKSLSASLKRNEKFGKSLKTKLDLKEQQIRSASKTISGAREAMKSISSERRRIAQLISGNLESSGVEVDINPETGNITLKMDDSFYFKNDSYQLSDSAKMKLGQVIPVYAKSLFGTKEISERIDGISITGFASPKYKRVFVDPFNTHGEAYDYNLALSMNRAQQIVAFMFGNEIPEFEYRNKLKVMTSVTGKGFMEPIAQEDSHVCSLKGKFGKTPHRCQCGPYDCKKSRRVEINFVLKNQKDVERHFDTIANTLKNRGYANVNR